VSSAILYLAIVAIWAFLLVPRWVRRGHSASFAGSSGGSESAVAEPESPGESVPARHTARPDAGPAGTSFASGASAASVAAGTDDADTAPLPAVTAPPASPTGPPASPAGGPQVAAGARTRPSRPSAPARPVISRGKILQARRRLLTILVLLAIAAASCTALRLTSPWVCIPPAVMLGMYVLLLRETALADSERAERRAVQAAAVRRQALARSRAAWAARTPAPVTVAASASAQIIDISGRLRDQLYDQYNDATIRAVGD
jgi:hypothetical protein